VGAAVLSFTVLWNFCIRYSPLRTGGYFGFSPGARQVGMQVISASQFGWWKKATDWRRVEPVESGAGFTTRWRVETQRSLVQRAMRSPILTMKPCGMAGTGCHCFCGLKISRPPAAESARRIVRLP